MSGRGRGRGRGRGAVPPSVAASSAYNYANASTSSLGSSSSAGPAGLVGVRTEPTQKFPDILLPEPAKEQDFSKSAKMAIIYADRLEAMIRASPSYRPLKSDQSKIDRYSDKYSKTACQSAENREKLSNLEADLSAFPEELLSVYVPGSAQVKAAKAKKHVSINEALSHLDELASKEEEKGDEQDEENKDAEEEEAFEEEEDEEFEDETDYAISYFDNGEDYGGDYDDGNDEAVF